MYERLPRRVISWVVEDWNGYRSRECVCVVVLAGIM